MFSRTPQPVAEHEARGDTARIYHEIRQTLRVSGVNLNFRTWAGFGGFLPAMWAAMQPVAASQAFESASDAVRARAVDLSEALPGVQATPHLGESQRYQIQKALALYHYINPKLLLFTVLVRRGLAGQMSSQASVDLELGPQVPFGPPSQMAAMEMVDERQSDRRLRRLFRDIKKTMALSSINSDYRTLALWPDYLEPAWRALKPLVRTAQYRQAADALRKEAANVADQFPAPALGDVRESRARGERADAVLEVTSRFERLLSPLIVNIVLLSRGWWPEDDLRDSPFPIVARDREHKRSGA